MKNLYWTYSSRVSWKELAGNGARILFYHIKLTDTMTNEVFTYKTTSRQFDIHNDFPLVLNALYEIRISAQNEVGHGSDSALIYFNRGQNSCKYNQTLIAS